MCFRTIPILEVRIALLAMRPLQKTGGSWDYFQQVAGRVAILRFFVLQLGPQHVFHCCFRIFLFEVSSFEAFDMLVYCKSCRFTGEFLGIRELARMAYAL